MTYWPVQPHTQGLESRIQDAGVRGGGFVEENGTWGCKGRRGKGNEDLPPLASRTQDMENKKVKLTPCGLSFLTTGYFL